MFLSLNGFFRIGKTEPLLALELTRALSTAEMLCQRQLVVEDGSRWSAR